MQCHAISIQVTVLSRCRHVNIIRYRDAYVSGTSLHIIMEYADGGESKGHVT